MVKLILDCPDNRLTPELLSQWSKEASKSVGLKVMVGSLDKKEDRYIIAVIGLVSTSKISKFEEKGEKPCP